MKKKNVAKSRVVVGVLTAAAGLVGAGSLISSDPAVAAQIDRWAGLAGAALALWARFQMGGLAILPTKSAPPSAPAP